MSPGLAGRLSRFLVGCYPPRWRQRYAEEMLEVLGQHRPTARTVLNLWASALGAHLDPAYRIEGLPRIRRHKKWLASAAAVGAVPLVLLLFAGVAAGQENLGNNGPPMPLSQGVFGMAFSPDGHTVAVINPNLEIWSVADPAHPRRLGYSKGDIVTGADPAFSPDGRVLATAGQQNVILWNVADPEPRPTEIADLPASASGVSAVLFSPDGHMLASGYADGTVVLWNTADPAAPAITATGRFPAPPPPPPGSALLPGAALAFSASGHTLSTMAGNSTVTVWNVTGSGGLTRATTITTDSIGSGPVAFSAGGRAAAGAPATGDSLALWTLP